MIKFLNFQVIIFLIAILVVACHSRIQTSNISKSSYSTFNSNSNLLQECVQTYNSKIDYFPDKISDNYAKGFVVEYHKNYKVVTLKNPWRNADTTFQYVLLQCGTPVPKGFKKTQVIQVPIKKIVSLSTTHLPHLDKLGVIDQLIGISDAKRVNTDSVIKKIKAGQLVELGNDTNLNIEKLLELNPDLVMTYGVGNSNIDSYPKLLEAGLKVALNSEYMETSPLGRAEWLKFTALFFNLETKAEKVFGQIAKKYEAIAAKVKSVTTRPSVFVGLNFKGTWYMPTGNSYVAKYLADAGANYLWKDTKSSPNLPLSFEQVFERAANADYWLNLSLSWKTLQDVLAEDNRYADFKAVKNGNLYNNNARVNPNGGNDYWEGGISNPDLVLSDLIKIFHPELLPNHHLFYYRKL